MAQKPSRKSRRYLERCLKSPAKPREMPAPAQIRAARDDLLKQMRIERLTQAQIWDDIKRLHGGDRDKITIEEYWDHLADRRESVLIAGRIQQTLEARA